MLSRKSPGFGIGQRGVGMIEVLVAVLVVAVGVIGYAGMQLYALRGAENAGHRTHATLIARDGLERIMANPAATNNYLTPANWPNGPLQPGTPYPMGCVNVACTPNQLSVADIAQLSWAAANSLPLGRVMASFDCTGVPSPSCVVVSWQGTEPAECLVGNQINTTDPCVVMEALR